MSTAMATMTRRLRRDVQRQDKTRVLALVQFCEQILNFVSVQITPTSVLHTSYLHKENAKGNENFVEFGTRGMFARYIASPLLRF